MQEMRLQFFMLLQMEQQNERFHKGEEIQQPGWWLELQQSPGSNHQGRVLHARQLDGPCPYPWNGTLQVPWSCCQDALLKGLPGASVGAAQVTGEEAALWQIAFVMPECGNCHMRSEPFTVPSWSVQPKVCPGQ